MRIAVIGGGIIGCLTACYLKRAGAEVVVLERGETGRESSWAGAGILCPIHPWLYPDAFTRLVDASLALYPDFEADIEARTGIDIERRQHGLMIPFFDSDTTDHWQPALEWSDKFGWRVEQLSGEAAWRQEPTLSPEMSRALFWPDVAQVRNPRLLQATHRWMQQLGIEILERHEAASLVLDDGRLAGVRCANGQTVVAEQVLLAGGSWSGEIAAQLGFELPVAPVKGQIVLLKGEPGLMRAVVKHDDAYFVPRDDGRILVGASMEFVGFKRGTTDAVVDQLLDAASRIAPGLSGLPVELAWMGFRPGSPDGLPFLGPVKSIPGLWVASGHYRNGVALAPITADVMSRWMLGETPSLDMSVFAIERPMTPLPKIGYPEEADR